MALSGGSCSHLRVSCCYFCGWVCPLFSLSFCLLHGHCWLVLVCWLCGVFTPRWGRVRPNSVFENGSSKLFVPNVGFQDLVGGVVSSSWLLLLLVCSCPSSPRCLVCLLVLLLLVVSSSFLSFFSLLSSTLLLHDLLHDLYLQWCWPSVSSSVLGVLVSK